MTVHPRAATCGNREHLRGFESTVREHRKDVFYHSLLPRLTGWKAPASIQCQDVVTPMDTPIDTLAG